MTKDQVLHYSIETSLTKYNEHITNIVALRNQIILVKDNIPSEDYDQMMDTIKEIHQFEDDAWKSLKQQAIADGIRQGLTEAEASLRII